MPVSVFVLAAALAQPAPAEAALPPILVPELQLGMEKQQFTALWPKSSALISQSCSAKMEAGFRHGLLDTVTLRSTNKDRGEACPKLVSDWAKSAYGKPTNEWSLPPNAGSCLKGHYGGLGPMSEDPGCETSEAVQVSRWETADRTVELKVQGDEWTVTASRP
jgi:hypothetical protein